MHRPSIRDRLPVSFRERRSKRLHQTTNFSRSKAARQIVKRSRANRPERPLGGALGKPEHVAAPMIDRVPPDPLEGHALRRSLPLRPEYIGNNTGIVEVKSKAEPAS
jgi:hypothetical protein